LGFTRELRKKTLKNAKIENANTQHKKTQKPNMAVLNTNLSSRTICCYNVQKMRTKLPRKTKRFKRIFASFIPVSTRLNVEKTN
jgi:hypothetical protein